MGCSYHRHRKILSFRTKVIWKAKSWNLPRQSWHSANYHCCANCWQFITELVVCFQSSHFICSSVSTNEKYKWLQISRSPILCVVCFIVACAASKDCHRHRCHIHTFIVRFVLINHLFWSRTFQHIPWPRILRSTTIHIQVNANSIGWINNNSRRARTCVVHYSWDGVQSIVFSSFFSLHIDKKLFAAFWKYWQKLVSFSAPTRRPNGRETRCSVYFFTLSSNLYWLAHKQCHLPSEIDEHVLLLRFKYFIFRFFTLELRRVCLRVFVSSGQFHVKCVNYDVRSSFDAVSSYGEKNWFRKWKLFQISFYLRNESHSFTLNRLVSVCLRLNVIGKSQYSA